MPSFCGGGFHTRDGFPIGDPEIVFKFRHPDLQIAAETDVRPHILGEHRVKFKCQALPLKTRASLAFAVFYRSPVCSTASL